MKTASTSGSAKTSSGSADVLGMPSPAAHSLVSSFIKGSAAIHNFRVGNKILYVRPVQFSDASCSDQSDSYFFSHNCSSTSFLNLNTFFFSNYSIPVCRPQFDYFSFSKGTTSRTASSREISQVPVVDINQTVPVMAHAKLLHVGKLPKPVAGFRSAPPEPCDPPPSWHRQDRCRPGPQPEYPEEARMPTFGVTTGSAASPSQSQETDMFRITLTKADVFTKMIHHRLGRFRHPLHKFFRHNIPRIGRTRRCMDHGFSDLSVRAADADVLVGTAEASVRMTLEMSQDKKGIIIQDIFSHGHFRKPFSALYGEHDRSLLIQNIHRAEIPSVDLQGLSVFFCRIPVSLIISIRLHDHRLRQILLQQGPHPGTRYDIGAVGFPCMELNRRLFP